MVRAEFMMPEGTRITMRPMTWEDIVADRTARLLDPVPARLVCQNTMVKPLRRAKVKSAPVDPACDPRLPSNTAAHVDRSAPASTMTAAKAASFRKATMRACPCRLCALALSPALTYADSERFGLASIGDESLAMTHGVERFAPPAVTRRPTYAVDAEPESDDAFNVPTFRAEETDARPIGQRR